MATYTNAVLLLSAGVARTVTTADVIYLSGVELDVGSTLWTRGILRNVDDSYVTVGVVGLGAGLGSTLKLAPFTTAQRDFLTPAEGAVVWNTSTKSLQIYNATGWSEVGSDITGVESETFTINTDTTTLIAPETVFLKMQNTYGGGSPWTRFDGYLSLLKNGADDALALYVMEGAVNVNPTVLIGNPGSTENNLVSNLKLLSSSGAGASQPFILSYVGVSKVFTIGATGTVSGSAIAVATDQAQISLTTVTSGEIDLTSAGLIDINAAAGLDIDVTGTVDILATSTFSIDGTGASNVTASTGNLTLSTVVSGSLILAGVALVDIDAGANLDIDVTGSVDILASTTFSIDGTGASNVSATSGNLTLSTLVAGDVNVSSVARINLTYTYVSTYVKNAGMAITAGDVLSIGADGELYLADADAAGKQMVCGVATATVLEDAPLGVAALHGSTVALNSNLAAASAGNIVYLTAVAGTVSTTAPTTAGNDVWRVGIVLTPGAAGANLVLFMPQFIASIPA